MEQFYQKVDNIDDKVKEANMPYMQWKVLFLVGENTSAEEISSLLGEDISTVEEILDSLNSKALIEKAEEAKTGAEAEKQPEDVTAPSIGDELLMEEEAVISQVDEQLEASTSEPEEEDMIPELEETFPESKEEFSLEPEEKTEEESISLDELTEEEETTSPDISVPEEPETAVAEEPEPAVEKPAEVESSDEEIISDSTRKTVMVIDDSIVIRKMIEIALEDEDYNIITAISGKEGLETIEKEKPNLVILDMMLPDMNGIEVLKTIKTDKKLPVIMLSGKDSPQLIETAREIGVDDFLPKPFRDEELVEKVKTLVEV
ncbi:MAG: response regulator [Calditrichia bacterium]|nr:response regulator [Calditrichia bacterium]